MHLPAFTASSRRRGITETAIFDEHAKKGLDRWVQHPLTVHDDPVYLDIAKRVLRIDHPAPGDLRTNIESLNESIDNTKDSTFYAAKAEIDKGSDGWLPGSARAEYEAAVKCIRHFETEHEAYKKMLNSGSYYLGHVIAGSGMNL
ncbi:uncharacterized protein N7515_007523 [Penicillium bovifimosum]|uniref:Uncharacterized protein n=1 Tax=Penicillium bovifimosum TaxID=126998 RepID=A0A9W9GY85_9EURO|nr:uncharacterized protein N7515_007523 [Penicillium bovifimosum]KAJ5131484.1 hypothetical protein N7515_007523 [Penicillium bovifimosum]